MRCAPAAAWRSRAIRSAHVAAVIVERIGAAAWQRRLIDCSAATVVAPGAASAPGLAGTVGITPACALARLSSSASAIALEPFEACKVHLCVVIQSLVHFDLANYEVQLQPVPSACTTHHRTGPFCETWSSDNRSGDLPMVQSSHDMRYLECCAA